MTIQKQRVTLFLDPELAKKAKIEAIKKDTTLTKMIEQLLQQQLSKDESKND